MKNLCYRLLAHGGSIITPNCTNLPIWHITRHRQDLISYGTKRTTEADATSSRRKVWYVKIHDFSYLFRKRYGICCISPCINLWHATFRLSYGLRRQRNYATMRVRANAWEAFPVTRDISYRSYLFHT